MSRNEDYETLKRMNNDENGYGIVYYRQKRKLYSPPGYEIKSKFLSRNQFVSLKDGSLLKMCFKYVSLNINILDSLIGLPEIIGKELLAFMLSNNVLNLKLVPISDADENETAKLRCLMTFDEAFGPCILSSLSFKTLSKPIPFVSRMLLCFQHLKELDLSGNLLNDETISAFYHLQKLEVLVLVDCGLSDFSIKKMTLPYRLYNISDHALKHLDIEGNKELTWNSITSIFVFKNLNILNVSGTRVKEKDLPLKQITDMKFEITHSRYDYDKPSTCGWAKQLIDEVCKRIDVSDKPNKRLKSNFYSSKDVKMNVNDKGSTTKNILYLVKRQTSIEKQSDVIPINTKTEGLTENKKKIKKTFFRDFESDDGDIMELYAK